MTKLVTLEWTGDPDNKPDSDDIEEVERKLNDQLLERLSNRWNPRFNWQWTFDIVKQPSKPKDYLFDRSVSITELTEEEIRQNKGPDFYEQLP
jgi:hypothetical protein